MNIDISPDELEKALESLPKEAHEIFINLVNQSNRDLKTISFFIENFDSQSAQYLLLAKIVAEVIVSVGRALNEDLMRSQDSGENIYGGEQAANAALKGLKKVYDDIQNALHCPDCPDTIEKKH